MPTQSHNIQQFLDQTDAKQSYIHDLKVLKYNFDKLPCLAVFQGRKSMPIINSHFETEILRQNQLDQIIKIAEKRVNHQRAIKKNQPTPMIRKDDIYVSSWGFEQTNISFYQVIKPLSTHFAIVSEIKRNIIPETVTNFTCDVLPEKDAFIGDQFRIKIKCLNKANSPNPAQYFTPNSFETAFLHDGKPKHQTSYH